MRGDRPDGRMRVLDDYMATPHARGSTHDWLIHAPFGVGYPACAGIDLSLQSFKHSLQRLPRMRGDRP